MKLKTCGASISGEDPITGCDVPICVVGINWPDRAEAAAMARRITLACNAHEGLLTALEQCLHWNNLDDRLCTFPPDKHSHQYRREVIEAALALARGQ